MTRQMYPYQTHVQASLRKGRSVIVQAPTGAGKTFAALYPYFQTLDESWGKPNAQAASLPLTCRYAVPMRVLATQFHREYAEWFSKLDQRGLDLRRTYVDTLEVPLPAIQTGEQPDDPRFESPLTFCTIDQLLASFIGSPYSLSRGQANINVAAVAGSYVILDEFHLYPLDKGQGARLTTLAMLRLLKGFAPFCLMTATFSRTLLDELGQLLDADVIRVEDPAELAQIMKGRARTIRRDAQPLTGEAIFDSLHTAIQRRAGAALVVCNTVARAQELYTTIRATLTQRGELATAESPDGVRVMLLHSRFTPEDRRKKSGMLETWLGEGQWDEGRYLGQPTIVIGTQVVEVGLNISAGVLHTEVAPANSVIQRAGRCARFAGQQGEVIVHPLAPNTKGTISYLPYSSKLCENTLAVLPEGATAFGFPEEQQLIDAVHTAEDRLMLNQFYVMQSNIEDTIRNVLTSHERGYEGDLIRNVRQVTILIHPDPKAAITRRPFDWEGFGMFPESLIGAYDALDARRHAFPEPDWTMCQLREEGDSAGDAETDNSRERTYTWDIITNKQQIRTATRVALPPQLATYDPDLGFRLLLDPELPTGTFMSREIPRNKGKRDEEPGKQSSYLTHITGLLRAYDFSVSRDMAWLNARLERSLRLANGSLDRAIRLAIACHDIGKLSRAWQAWAKAWQALLVTSLGPAYTVKFGNEWLAKTDRHPDWRTERVLQSQMRLKRPHHACESAVASAQFIARQILMDIPTDEAERYYSIAQAVISAVARHHAPTAKNYGDVAWDVDARSAIRSALQACRLPIEHLDDLNFQKQSAGKLEEVLLFTPAFGPSQHGQASVWLAFAIVRALRLCDQRAEREL